MHRGIDYGHAIPGRSYLGADVYAAADGVVADARGAARSGQPGWVGGFGGWIVLDHTIDGEKVSTVYGHLYPGDILVAKGDRVTRGQLITRVGNNGDSTGAHLHFECWRGGRLTGGTAVDPEPWFK